ncbi:dTDP-4-dehydrorhamnose 3,5-epimerase family protein [Dyadobacter sp. CY261]|uniref:dTDP-4-dehydrorhamnose 3,5-epimerase family protein n=1 Tax=Dyadobacter sp. CY261 TaxID=2907203 RepID=UPI001F358EB5|nr:dTDP-4-dehydrorhamnose 3,5-epimerase family protein [Dyadobacter sp. CY261]MCF0072569.1 dTDP-4-dehydrorhamnose 3,5-epimerase family protein [Dyadobacter sp. CY261]
MVQTEKWSIDGAIKDAKSITAQWNPSNLALIEGVKVKEVKNVVKNNGFLTEIFRQDWELDNLTVDQIFQVSLLPGGISAWHAHEVTTDRIFVNTGLIKVVLYDARPESSTYGQINEFRCGTVRPMLIIVPPRVWHGVQNFTNEHAALLNIVDRAYQYEDPDHWRIPVDSPEVPYTFS